MACVNSFLRMGELFHFVQAQRERERARERESHTHTHTHTCYIFGLTNAALSCWCRSGLGFELVEENEDIEKANERIEQLRKQVGSHRERHTRRLARTRTHTHTHTHTQTLMHALSPLTPSRH